jgi:hypothetical protein
MRMLRKAIAVISSEVIGGLILAAILAALLACYELVEIIYPIPACAHSRCRVEGLKAR